ncbi:MAG: tetratricopeptide repeat protein, partial [Chitinophagaceae bacterium]|nr:tetratricopeptide repeat protein [Chitinophagaceae bacterium]
ANSRTAALELRDKIPPIYLQIPGALRNYLQYQHQSPLFTLVRFGKWNDILELKVNDSLRFTSVLQHFSRGMALAKTQKINEAKIELSKMEQAMKDPALKVPLTPFNDAYHPSLIAFYLLQGTIAEQQEKWQDAINHFKEAVVTEDNLIYNEPRDWLLPARQYLGKALVAAGQYTEAIKVFEKDLEINPNNGWSLSGLRLAYQKSGKSSMAMAVNKSIATAWKIKDVVIEDAVF